jgi:hypothetical protein
MRVHIHPHSIEVYGHAAHLSVRMWPLLCRAKASQYRALPVLWLSLSDILQTSDLLPLPTACLQPHLGYSRCTWRLPHFSQHPGEEREQLLRGAEA